VKILEACHITKSFSVGFKQKKTVLKNANFYLNLGELVCLAGKSGEGKTTFLKILAQIIAPHKGQIFYKEKKLNFFNKGAFQKNFSFVFQDYKLIPHLNVFENASLPLRLKNYPQLKEKTYQALEFCKVAHLDKRYPWQLSGGESQRVSLARALSTQPEIIFADEPTGNLDQETEGEILKVIWQMHQELKMSFVIVTHESDILKMANRVYWIQKGELLESHS